MADVIINFSVTIVDKEGKTSNTTAHQKIDDATTLADIILARDAYCAAVQAAIDGTVQQCSISSVVYDSFILPTTLSAYSNVEDKAFLEFRSLETGVGYSTSLSTPKVSMFDLDNETLNPLDSTITALITMVEGNFSTSSGNAGLKFVAGYRKRSKARQESVGRYKAKG